MGSIPRGTTPTIRFTYSQVDVATIVAAYLIIKQGPATIAEKSLDAAEIGADYLEWTLTQEETLSFKVAPDCRDSRALLYIQCRYRLADGTAGTSRTYKMEPYAILKDGEI